MNRIRNINLNLILEYLIVIICIFCSGAVAFQNNNKIILIISTLFMAGLYILKKQKFVLKPHFLIFMFLYLLTCIMHSFQYNSNLVGEMGKIVQFMLAILACYIIKPKNFFDKYNKILYFLAFSSIILYLIPFLYPEFPNLFPIIYDYAGSEFHNAGLFCYPSYIGNYYRNQSIFWESGAFQAFLNIALFIELYIFNKNSNKKHIIIYSIALLLTKSTTGYIIFIILFMGKILKSKRLKKNKINLSFIISPVFVLLFVFIFDSVIIDKFSPNSMSYVSFLRRSSDSIIDFKILFSNINYFLFGVGEKKYITLFTNLLNSTGIGVFKEAVSSNSIASFAAQYGIISALPIYFIYLKGIISVEKNYVKIIAAIMIIFCLITENFIMSPIFLCIMIQLTNYKNIDNIDYDRLEVNYG